MLDRARRADPLDDLEPVTDAIEVGKLIDAVRAGLRRRLGRRYAVDLVNATRQAPEIRLGASPRATLQLRARPPAAAALDGRDYVLPDDVQALVEPVLAHRLMLTRRGPAQPAYDRERADRHPVPDAGTDDVRSLERREAPVILSQRPPQEQ